MMNIPTISYLNEEGKFIPPYEGKIPDDILIKGYQMMCLTRHIDERMITLQRQGTITFALSTRGEEACAVASAAALSKDDWMQYQYREAGIVFWRGLSPQQYIHQMFGNAKDISKGRQMPNFTGSRALNVVIGSAPIASNIAHASGNAYAMKLLKEKTVTICYFGEGASSEGDFHAGLTFAAVKKVPAIFFCRNNGYAISTPACKQFATDGVAPQGIGHGIQTYRVDGNDFFAIYDTVSKAKEECLKGNGPVFIEAMTYRMGAHTTSDDPTRYRTPEEVEKWDNKCPILRLRRYLESKKLWDQEKEDAYQKEIKEEVDKAIEVAKNTEKPSLHSMFEDVYFEVPKDLEEQYKQLKKLFPD
jgi:2-oxoisovalerate dehydrogenase E1 component alpha subunit